MESTNKVDEYNVNFLKEILTNKKVSLQDFEDNITHFTFGDDNKMIWQFVIIKSFELDFHYLMPLANHLIDHNYYEVDTNVVQYAALNGLQLEKSLEKIKDLENNINDNMQAFHFDEKLVITNEPAQNIYNLSKKIMSRSNDNDYLLAKEIVEKAGVDINTSKLMFRNTTKSLKY